MPGCTDIWDTAGQERFNSIHASYYYRAHVCIMVFDVTRKVTYKNLEKWYAELQEHCKGIPTIVVANKIDVDYKVPGGGEGRVLIAAILKFRCCIQEIPLSSSVPVSLKSSVACGGCGLWHIHTTLHLSDIFGSWHIPRFCLPLAHNA